jgi:hypothetical protein
MDSRLAGPLEESLEAILDPVATGIKTWTPLKSFTL